MNNIKNYNQARLELESRFDGLPHTHTTLIKSLISRADPITGLVEGLNYRDLADILKVDHAPGRKGCGTPQKQTIRSYLRTIEDNCSDNFRLISFGQKIKFQFIQMPKIYTYFFDQNDLYIEDESHSKPSNLLDKYETFNTVDVICNLEKSFNYPGEVDDENGAKKVLYLNKNKLTNSTAEISLNFSSPKQPISPDFYPNAETIAKALSRGFESVTDTAELSAFIRHNELRSTQWVDFNPVYLQWLERGAEYQQRKQATQHLRSKHYGYNGIESNRKNLLEIVREHNPDAMSPNGQPCGGTFIDKELNYEQTPRVVMATADELIRSALREQEWRNSKRHMA